ncbi:uncharacterized protein EV154DRAFT_572617 [Mucor mucedo]|uniref:uncharacterized protein n=1 Tax=Mucor mucedo TaxID=29922 RepID=UPI00221FC8B5|nr:uncharacterized protein EV154DRAFT_572617 [Mucor mucedo]KAI7863924.1 hypothetical protein EV154DRAFT_572617 [Mucor mucedo]
MARSSKTIQETRPLQPGALLSKKRRNDMSHRIIITNHANDILGEIITEEEQEIDLVNLNPPTRRKKPMDQAQLENLLNYDFLTESYDHPDLPILDPSTISLQTEYEERRNQLLINIHNKYQAMELIERTLNTDLKQLLHFLLPIIHAKFKNYQKKVAAFILKQASNNVASVNHNYGPASVDAEGVSLMEDSHGGDDFDEHCDEATMNSTGLSGGNTPFLIGDLVSSPLRILYENPNGNLDYMNVDQSALAANANRFSTVSDSGADGSKAKSNSLKANIGYLGGEMQRLIEDFGRARAAADISRGDKSYCDEDKALGILSLSHRDLPKFQLASNVL